MTRRQAGLLIPLVLLTVACSAVGKKKVTREAVLPELQKEAEAMKRDGEKMNPSLGVKATWTIHAVDVQEQAGNASQPFRGSVKFRINSQAQEPTGVVEHNFERTYNYVYDAALGKWLFKP